MPPELCPAIVQDAESGRILMLAWMNDEAKRRTRTSGEVWFWSRSRGRLWHKGETSGNTLAVIEMRDDCDGDAVLVRALPSGPVCHSGSMSCFAPDLWRVVTSRALERPKNSYVTSLLDGGVAVAARKVGEEAVETVTAALTESDERLVEEGADLVFHLYVLLATRGVDLAAVEDALAKRRRSRG